MQITNFERVYNEILHWSACMPLPIEIERVIPSLTFIRERVCEILDVDEKSLTRNNREQDVAFARLLSMAIAVCYKERYGTKWTFTDIAYTIGRKTHTMALYAAKEISNMVDSKYRIDDITNVIGDFDLLLTEFKYYPQTRPSYKDIKVYEGDNLVGEFPSIAKLRKGYALGEYTIHKHINTKHLFKGKYQIKCNITNS